MYSRFTKIRRLAQTLSFWFNHLVVAVKSIEVVVFSLLMGGVVPFVACVVCFYPGVLLLLC